MEGILACAKTKGHAYQHPTLSSPERYRYLADFQQFRRRLWNTYLGTVNFYFLRSLPFVIIFIPSLRLPC